MHAPAVLVYLAAPALVITGVVSAAAEVVPTELTEWVSDDGGSAGRELPAMSADGRYVVYVARSSAFKGVWIKDRMFPDKAPVKLASGDLFNPDISADGTHVVWAKYGTPQEILIYEWQNPKADPEVVSVNDAGDSVATPADYPSVSRNGRYVAFQIKDSGLDDEATPGAEGGGPDKVYVRDRKIGDTEMVSVTDDGVIVNGNAIKPDISPNGRYVAFASDASVLQEVPAPAVAAAAEEETTFQQVYVRDRTEETTTMVSVTPEGAPGNNISSPLYGPTVSADGSLVAFESDATDLVAEDTNDDTDAFVRDLAAEKTVRISLDYQGKQVDMPNPDVPEPVAAAGPGGGGDATADLTPNVGAGPVLSSDGAYVAFESDAALTPDDQNSGEVTYIDPQTLEEVTALIDVTDVYRYKVDGGALDRQSVANADGTEATGIRVDGNSGVAVPVNNGVDPAISADGTRVAFVSNGDLSGDRPVATEELAVAAEEEEVSTEPTVFLHRPNPEPDVVAPTSQAKSKDYANTKAFPVKYDAEDPGFPASGVDKVRLFAKAPGENTFAKVRVDVAPDLDGAFTYRSDGTNGTYRFYTVAVDVTGNVEATPDKADTAVVLDTKAPKITDAKVVPSPFDISEDGRATLSMRISEKANTTFTVKANGIVVKSFKTELSKAGKVSRSWNGTNDAGRLVRDGRYTVVMKAKDLAGNTTSVSVAVRVTR